MDSPTSSCCERNSRKNIRNILAGLGFKDTPQSRKLDPWMTAVLARQQQEETRSTNKPPILQSNINHSTIPLKNHHDSNIKKRPYSDLDSVSPKHNDKSAFVGKRFKNCYSKKQRKSVAPRSGSVKTSVAAPAHRVEKELPVGLRNMIMGEMGGSDLLFVTEKALTWTDLNQQQSRFSIPERQVANEFLNKEEKSKVKKGINVKLVICNHDYHPGSDETHEHNINLTKWQMVSSMVYVLNKTWNPIVKEHKLEEDMRVQLWSFRVQSQLYFAFVRL